MIKFKFKVGDKVQVIKPRSGYERYKNKKGTILKKYFKTRNSSSFYKIEIDKKTTFCYFCWEDEIIFTLNGFLKVYNKIKRQGT